MRFVLIDRIVELQPGVRVTATKALTMAEEYLADHFPNFPVIPGVLMLEAMTQAAAWLIRVTDDFAHSMVVLRQANNVKYARFLEPGQTLVVTAEIFRHGEGQTQLKARGQVEGRTIVSAKLLMESYNLADRNPAHAGADEVIKKELRAQFANLFHAQGTPAQSPQG